MDEFQVVRIAQALDLQDAESMLDFVRMLAEHCAQLAEECPPDKRPIDAAAAIRRAFSLKV
jgi:hypothetical protein